MRRYAWIGWVVTVAAALAFGAQPAAASKGKPKPDLYVRGAEFLPIGEDHALRGEDNVLRFEAQTQNRGKGAAKPSKTEIVFVPLDGPRVVKPIHAFSLDVPRIRGYTHKYFSAFGEAKSPPLTFSGEPLGTYQAFWCADAEDKVKESNERNNCVVPGGDLQRLYLGKRHWTGTVSGTGQVGDAPTGAHEDWSSSSAELEFERVGSGGIFFYNFNGTVSWAMQGTDGDGCSYDGSGTDSIQGGPGNGDFQLDYVDDQYSGVLYSDLDDTFPVTIQCPTPSGTETTEDLGPFYGLFLDTRVDGQTLPLPFGTEVIAGSNTDNAHILRTTWTWEFR